MRYRTADAGNGYTLEARIAARLAVREAASNRTGSNASLRRARGTRRSRSLRRRMVRAAFAWPPGYGCPPGQGCVSAGSAHAIRRSTWCWTST